MQRGRRGDGDHEEIGHGPHASHDVAHAYAADHAATYESDTDDEFEADVEEDEDVDSEDVNGGDVNGEDDDAEFGDDEDEEEDDDLASADGEDEFASADPELEDRVLEVFVNDPVLAECPVDIGAIRAGTIELTGGVQTREEYEHATTLARGVPGVETVVNRLDILEEEVRPKRTPRRITKQATRGTPNPDGKGEKIGTGRRRQGTSHDVGLHEDPKVPPENRATRGDARRSGMLPVRSTTLPSVAWRHGRAGEARSHGPAADAEPRQDPSRDRTRAIGPPGAVRPGGDVEYGVVYI